MERKIGSQEGEGPPVESAADRVRGVVTELRQRPPRGQGGRFIGKPIDHGARSAALLAKLEPLRAERVMAYRRQLGADTDDAPPTLLAWIDMLARTELLADAMWWKTVQQGGPITHKGRTRGSVDLWLKLMDRQMRLIDKLGLTRVSRQVPQSPREWLMEGNESESVDTQSNNSDHAIDTDPD